jgi:hypothetical protein
MGVTAEDFVALGHVVKGVLEQPDGAVDDYGAFLAVPDELLYEIPAPISLDVDTAQPLQGEP